MTKINRHAVQGVTTQVGERLRIVNGTVDSLKKFPKKAGRKKKVDYTPSTPEYPAAVDLKSMSYRLRAGFHPIRTRKDWETKAEAGRELQAEFEEKCTEPVVTKVPVEELASIFGSDNWFQEHHDPATYSRIEWPVPKTFCSCKHKSPCLVHGTKLDDCACGGINGITGYRSCGGHKGRRNEV